MGSRQPPTADELVEEGESAHFQYVLMRDQAASLDNDAMRLAAQIDSHAPIEDKRRTGMLLRKSERARQEAGKELASAEELFIRALTLEPTHPRARHGFATIAYGQFEQAEKAGDHVGMAKYIHLARTFDDGQLARLLADTGVVTIDAPAALEWTVRRYEETEDRLLRPASMDATGTGPAEVTLKSGSYVVLAQDFRWPLLVTRAYRHRVTLRAPMPGQIPEGMVYVPGGQFLARPDLNGKRVERARLPDFAIGRFPVTLETYTAFLSSLPEAERKLRTPQLVLSDNESVPLVAWMDGSWRVHPGVMEEAARSRFSYDRDLDIPAHCITGLDAIAFVEWYARQTCRPYRLPTDLEWEKAARGVDGRLFPMGHTLDPAFTSRRESRPWPTCPEPIGTFPLDESPYGVRDLAGNVADYTSTFVEAAEPQVVYRGGSYGGTVAVQHAMRFQVPTRHRAVYIGFRLALSLDGPGSDFSSDAPAD